MMGQERMASVESIIHRIMPQVIPCPRSMALDALQMLAVDFFRESGVWAVTFQEVAGPCDTVIPLQLPKGAVLAGVNELYMNDVRLDRSDYIAGTREITIYAAVPENGALIIAKGSLRPLRTATELPEDILEEYGDTLAFGAIAKLKSMNGQFVEWSDAQGASLYYQLYTDGISQAKARKFRKRLGGGVLYVNTGEL